MALSKRELRALRQACQRLGPGRDYRCDDYARNVLALVLDFRMHAGVAGAAAAHFRAHHGARVSHRALCRLLDAFPDTRPGNRALAQCLWGAQHWSRAAFLRALLAGFEARGIHGPRSLARWARAADFARDVRGQFRSREHSLGFALFHWLRLRAGVATVKPDVHVRAFVSRAISRQASAAEAVDGLIAVARQLHPPGPSARCGHLAPPTGRRGLTLAQLYCLHNGQRDPVAKCLAVTAKALE